MTTIEIEPQEAQAYVELLKDAKMPPEMGYLLTSLKFKIFKAFEAEKNEQAKKVVADMLKNDKKKAKAAKVEE